MQIYEFKHTINSILIIIHNTKDIYSYGSKIYGIPYINSYLFLVKLKIIFFGIFK